MPRIYAMKKMLAYFLIKMWIKRRLKCAKNVIMQTQENPKM